MKTLAAVVIAAISLCAASSAVCAEPDAQDAYSCAMHALGTINTDTANTVSAGSIRLDLHAVYFIQNGEFDSHWNRKGLAGRNEILFLPMKLTYGIIDDWEMSVTLPYIYNRVKDDAGRRDEAGLGGVRLATKVRFLCDRPGSWAPSIAGVAWIKFGNSDFIFLNPHVAFMDHYGTRNTDVAFGISMSKRIDDLVLHLNFYYDIPSSVKYDRARMVVADLFYYGLAGEYLITDGVWAFLEANGLLEFNYHLDSQDPDRDSSDNIGLSAGMELDLGKGFTMRAAFGMTVAGENSAFGYMPSLSLTKTF